MMYHKDCGATGERKFGWPIVCVEHFRAGYGEYQCPACKMLWDIGDDEKLPEDIEQLEGASDE